MIINDNLQNSDPAEIVEVDLFGPDLENPQHDGVQRW
jgi:hypothetical protein